MSLDVYLEVDGDEVYWRNITHNVNKMAEAAGIYQHLWRPDEIGITTAKQLIEPLATGVALLASDADRFKAYDSLNGWGLYEHFLPFVAGYLVACRANPEALVRVSR